MDEGSGVGGTVAYSGTQTARRGWWEMQLERERMDKAQQGFQGSQHYPKGIRSPRKALICSCFLLSHWPCDVTGPVFESHNCLCGEYLAWGPWPAAGRSARGRCCHLPQSRGRKWRKVGQFKRFHYLCFMGWIMPPPPKSYAEALSPSTSKCVWIWR